MNTYLIKEKVKKYDATKKNVVEMRWEWTEVYKDEDLKVGMHHKNEDEEREIIEVLKIERNGNIVNIGDKRACKYKDEWCNQILGQIDQCKTCINNREKDETRTGWLKEQEEEFLKKYKKDWKKIFDLWKEVINLRLRTMNINYHGIICKHTNLSCGKSHGTIEQCKGCEWNQELKYYTVNTATWQTCPVCEGIGKVQDRIVCFSTPTTGDYGIRIVECHVCKGHGIINSETGKPPEK